MKNIRIFAAANRKIDLRRIRDFNAVKSNRGVVQLASILAWGASGRPFESGHSDKKGQQTICCPFIVFIII